MAAPFVRTSTPGIYRRGSRYVVTYRDPTGRRRKRSAATLAEARLLKSSLWPPTSPGASTASRPASASTSTHASGFAPTRAAPAVASGRRRSRSTAATSSTTSSRSSAAGGSREIEPRHVKALARHLADQGLAPATVRVVMAPVRALFATAVEEGLIRSNPCAGLRLAGRAAPADGSEDRRGP